MFLQPFIEIFIVKTQLTVRQRAPEFHDRKLLLGVVDDPLKFLLKLMPGLAVLNFSGLIKEFAKVLEHFIFGGYAEVINQTILQKVIRVTILIIRVPFLDLLSLF